jgi:hypothetical protein
LTSLSHIPSVEVTSDQGIFKQIVQEGKGDFIGEKDEVFYKHESRFDKGQLVDITEKRKAIDKFMMGDQYCFDYYKLAFRSMKKGECAWFRFNKLHHKDVYFNGAAFKNKSEEEREKIGEWIYIKFTIVNLKRNLILQNGSTYEGKVDYYNRARVVGRELMEEGEYVNAQSVYAKSLQEFKHMPKKMRGALSEE